MGIWVRETLTCSELIRFFSCYFEPAYLWTALRSNWPKDEPAIAGVVVLSRDVARCFMTVTD